MIKAYKMIEKLKAGREISSDRFIKLIIVGIYRTAPGRHSKACRTFPVSVITSITVVVSYEARTRVTPLNITFIYSFSLEGRHKL